MRTEIRIYTQKSRILSLVPTFLSQYLDYYQVYGTFLFVTRLYIGI
jgi:hypothetical protein